MSTGGRTYPWRPPCRFQNRTGFVALDQLYYHIPFSSSAPDPTVVDTFLKTIAAPGVQPAFIH